MGLDEPQYEVFDFVSCLLAQHLTVLLVVGLDEPHYEAFGFVSCLLAQHLTVLPRCPGAWTAIYDAGS